MALTRISVNKENNLRILILITYLNVFYGKNDIEYVTWPNQSTYSATLHLATTTTTTTTTTATTTKKKKKKNNDNDK